MTYKEIDEKSYMMSEYKNKIAINTHGAQLDAEDFLKIILLKLII